MALGIVGVGVLLAFGLTVWSTWRRGEGIVHVVFGASVLAVGVVIILLIASSFRAINSEEGISLKRLAWVLGFLSFTEAVGLGQYLGRAVLETNNTADIKTKDATMGGVKVVIVMSRHTVLLKEKEIFIVPTADITQFHGAAPPFNW
jgi:hypothetical protein